MLHGLSLPLDERKNLPRARNASLERQELAAELSKWPAWALHESTPAIANAYIFVQADFIAEAEGVYRSTEFMDAVGEN
jgi:hypothetical protein